MSSTVQFVDPQFIGITVFHTFLCVHGSQQRVNLLRGDVWHCPETFLAGCHELGKERYGHGVVTG